MSLRVSVEHGMGRIVLSNPPLNILTLEVLGRLQDELRCLSADASLRALLLTADGPHFCAGADVREHLPPTFHTLIPEFLATVTALDDVPVPVIAAVQGRCLGGGFELVLGTDFLIAADDASVGQPEIALGVIPPVACAVLPRLCPAGVAAELLFTGDPICARDAERAGIVWRVVPAAELEAAALELACRLTRHSAAALRMAKRAMREGREHGRASSMALASRLYTEELMRTVDASEGLRAFLEKRPPIWSHQ